MNVDETIEELSKTITSEEREKIDEEITELVLKEKTATDQFDFSVKEAGRGLKFPLIVISSMMFLMIISFLGSWFYSFKAEQAMLQIHIQQITSETILAQSIIEESKRKAVMAQQQLDILQEELKNAQTEKNGLQGMFEDRIATFERELERQTQQKLEELRAELEAEGLSEDIIQERINQLRTQLTQQNNFKLAEFKQAQNTQRVELEREYQQRIENLEAQQNQRSNELEELLTQIAQKEQETIANTGLTIRELTEAERELIRITSNNIEKGKAIDSFNLFLRNVAILISEDKYEAAMESAQEGKRKIQESLFYDDFASQTYLYSLEAYINVVSLLIDAQSNLNEIQNSAATLSSSNQEVLSIQEELLNKQDEYARTIENLTAQLNTERTKLTVAQKEIQAYIANTQNLEREIKTANETVQTLSTRFENASRTVAEQELVSLNLQEKLLENINAIVVYLENKTRGINDSDITRKVNELIKLTPVYEQIGSLIAEQKNRVSFP